MSQLEIHQYNIWFIKMHIVNLLLNLNNGSRKSASRWWQCEASGCRFLTFNLTVENSHSRASPAKHDRITSKMFWNLIFVLYGFKYFQCLCLNPEQGVSVAAFHFHRLFIYYRNSILYLVFMCLRHHFNFYHLSAETSCPFPLTHACSH